ncbi:VWA domain-containing protein [Ornithinimicrobium avium]|uniref:VWA domain-containing protein n=2 Tax=Ornithinimicrobium avium TaxID=2283195 RepID=A0A345NMI6_9MICO|nr:VWA domain-containing protein [Ornithinimicrobium avium]
MRHAAAATAAILVIGTTTAYAAVDPPTYSDALDPGASVTITKTVTTPEVLPQPDIVLLVDRTGSMGGAITNVKANMATIVSTVEAAQPDAQWAVASYCDVGEPDPFLLHSDLGADTTATVAAVNSIRLCGGGDEPEAQLNALWEIGDTGDAVAFRPDSSRIVVWFGDAPGHDPSLGHTEADATSSLVDAGATVLAVSVGADRLDATGQATRITDVTGGALYSGVDAGDLADTILAGITALPVEVGATTTCDPGLSATLDPATRTVTSGDAASFSETITVAADAEQGATLGCQVAFTLNGTPAGDGFVQTVSVDVNDVTPPVVACEQGPNPSGNYPRGGNADGFFMVTASDNVDGAVEVWVDDTGSDALFGAYADGTTFKITQAPGATPKATPFVGAVDWKLRLKGDALMTVTDAAGNTATALCEVPPKG